MLKECLLLLQVIKQYVMHVIDGLDGFNLLRIAQVTRPKHPKSQSNESLTIASIVWLIGRDWGTDIKHFILVHISCKG